MGKKWREKRSVKTMAPAELLGCVGTTPEKTKTMKRKRDDENEGEDGENRVFEKKAMVAESCWVGEGSWLLAERDAGMALAPTVQMSMKRKRDDGDGESEVDEKRAKVLESCWVGEGSWLRR